MNVTPARQTWRVQTDFLTLRLPPRHLSQSSLWRSQSLGPKPECLVCFLPFTLCIESISRSSQLSLQNTAEPLWCHHPYLSLLGSTPTSPSSLLSGLPASRPAPREQPEHIPRGTQRQILTHHSHPGWGSHRLLRVLMGFPSVPHLLTTSPPVLAFSHFLPSCSSSEK